MIPYIALLEARAMPYKATISLGNEFRASNDGVWVISHVNSSLHARYITIIIHLPQPLQSYWKGSSLSNSPNWKTEYSFYLCFTTMNNFICEFQNFRMSLWCVILRAQMQMNNSYFKKEFNCLFIQIVAVTAVKYLQTSPNLHTNINKKICSSTGHAKFQLLG